MLTVSKRFTFLLFFLVSINCIAQFNQYNNNYEVIDTRQGLAHKIVLSLLQDSEGYLWIGTYNGLCIYDGAKITRFQNVFGNDKNVLQAIEVIYEDREKNIWAGTRYGSVCRYNKKTQHFDIYLSKINSAISAIFQDRKGRVWYGYRM